MKKLKLATVKKYSTRRLARWIGDNIGDWKFDAQYDWLKSEENKRSISVHDLNRHRILLVIDDAGCISGDPAEVGGYIEVQS